MAEKIVLDAQPRTTIGKQVNQLRRANIVPAIIYGPKLAQSISIQADGKQLQESLRKAGGYSLIEITIGGETHNTLVRSVQRDAIKGHVLHVDFYAVALDTKIRTTVPVMLVGEAPAVRSGQGLLVTNITTVEVECLPQNIPSELQLDVTRVMEVGDELTVADLTVPENVTVLSDPEEVLVHATYAAAREVDEETGSADAESVEVIKRGKADEEDF